jgi:alpha-galactosidase
MPVTAYFRDVGIGDAASVRDLWEKRDLGVFNSSFTAQVPTHGVVLLRVK